MLGATLVLPVKENEPFLQDRVVPRMPGAGNSIRVAELDRVVKHLHPGSRIDIQAVSEKTGATELRTILQNVERERMAKRVIRTGRGARATAALTRAHEPPTKPAWWTPGHGSG